MGNLNTFLSNIPRNQDVAEASARAAGFEDLAEVRAEIFAAVGRGERFPAKIGDKISPICKVINMEAYSPALVGMFLDAKLPLHQRQLALTSAFHTAWCAEIYKDLGEEEKVRFCRPWVRPMLEHGRDDEFPRIALVMLYKATSQPHRGTLVEHICECIKEVGATAAAVERLISFAAPEHAARLRGAL